jgi:haloacid dehalogenase superfamily, subfamily IA, variant 3 with third motif having DD or ED
MANSRAALIGYFTPTKWVCASPTQQSMPRWTAN